MRLRPLSVLVLIVILVVCRPAARAATILFMVANAAQLTNADPAIVRLLRARDHEVILYTAPGTTREQQIAAADNVDLVLISESLGSSSVAPDGVFSLKGHEVAVVSFEAYMWDDADWTGRIQYDLGTDAPSCAKASDSNDNGAVALDDAVYLFNHLFLGGPDPKAPFPECGVDPSEDGLECAEFAPCEG